MLANTFAQTFTYIPYAEHGSYNGYRALVLRPDLSRFIAGDGDTLAIAIQIADDCAKNLAGVAFPRATRTLRTFELEAMSESDLTAREAYLHHKRTNGASNELRRIHHIKAGRAQ